MKTEDLVILNEEIAGMARAGLPLDKGLAALAREMGRGRLQKVTAQLAADLEAGHPLPEAIARQGKHMPPFYAGLVEAAIRTGRVNEVLATLALYGRTVTNLPSSPYITPQARASSAWPSKPAGASKVSSSSAARSIRSSLKVRSSPRGMRAPIA